MLDEARKNEARDGDFVEFARAGMPAAGEYHCSELRLRGDDPLVAAAVPDVRRHDVGADLLEPVHAGDEAAVSGRRQTPKSVCTSCHAARITNAAKNASTSSVTQNRTSERRTALRRSTLARRRARSRRYARSIASGSSDGASSERTGLRAGSAMGGL